ncbi:hypothetical protein E2C01_064412 [Portunus trituberculatus]|uniref:Uncharacterized protein n=1 Tax=Portunus trituberculatus TaxID=210409 RepID=A0A5B7HBT0_PORTR|nr:hypothetical protein [Portunus trituberculatus]
MSSISSITRDRTVHVLLNGGPHFVSSRHLVVVGFLYPAEGESQRRLVARVAVIREKRTCHQVTSHHTEAGMGTAAAAAAASPAEHHIAPRMNHKTSDIV